MAVPLPRSCLEKVHLGDVASLWSALESALPQNSIGIRYIGKSRDDLLDQIRLPIKNSW